jgi:hypothetical protein
MFENLSLLHYASPCDGTSWLRLTKHVNLAGQNVEMISSVVQKHIIYAPFGWILRRK